MPTLKVIAGFPGAGKSTLARQEIASTGAVLIGRDELRRALVNCSCEATLTLAMISLAWHVLRVGQSVVVDAWNLHPRDRARWQELADEFEIELSWVHLDTPIGECIRRDALRADPVGERRIRGIEDETRF